MYLAVPLLRLGRFGHGGAGGSGLGLGLSSKACRVPRLRSLHKFQTGSLLTCVVALALEL